VSIVAFVPARCGSKSIRLKNIRPFCGKPLLYWCLNALEQTEKVGRIVVATDCHEIVSNVKDFNFSKLRIFHRDEQNARDTSSTEDVMLEYLNAESFSGDDLFILVQATNPFSTTEHFEAAIAKFNSNSFDSMLSCCRVKRFLWSEEGQPLNYQYQQRPRRQDFPGSMMENGAFYINSIANILSSGNRLSGRIGVYEMPSYAALELDEEDDWLNGEYLMRKYVLTSGTSKNIKLLLSDVDGVLTDAGMYYTEDGDELKKFNTYDGMGFQLLQKRGVKVGIITKEDRELNRRRAKKLGLDFHYHGVDNKLELVQKLCLELGIGLQEVAYIGDDVNDKELLEAVGLAACPANARNSIKAIPGIIRLSTAGGSGAVRELVENFLLQRGET
jgi:N-acylneuraminate cytidylyltransferase